MLLTEELLEAYFLNLAENLPRTVYEKGGIRDGQKANIVEDSLTGTLESGKVSFLGRAVLISRCNVCKHTLEMSSTEMQKST